MNRSTKHLLSEYITDAPGLAEYTGMKAESIQQKAWRGKIEFVKIGKLKNSVLLFDKRDFKPKPHVVRPTSEVNHPAD